MGSARESSVGASESFEREREKESDFTMSREQQQQQQQLVLGTEPWVYRSKMEMLNGHNGDIPPQPVLPVLEEPETNMVQPVAAPSGSREVTPGGSRIFIQAPQYYGKSCSRLGGGHGHWLALGWHWYHSDQCYYLGRITG